MKKQILVGLVMGLLLVGGNGAAQAALTTIGTATYNGSDYKLIWENNNNDKSLVWLDYTHESTTWYPQRDWAAGLDSALTINLDPGYSITWDDASWRLPATVDGPYSYGYNTKEGYNITSSEMGYLYYTELGNLGRLNTSGGMQSGYGLQNTGDFDHLVATWYWSGTEAAYFPGDAWYFKTSNGYQDKDWKNSIYANGLAVRSGQVSAAPAPVPVPATIFLMGSGLAGLIGVRRKRK